MVTDRLRLTVGIFSFVFILLLPQNSRVYLQIKTMYLSTLFNVRRVPKFKFETNLFFLLACMGFMETLCISSHSTSLALDPMVSLLICRYKISYYYFTSAHATHPHHTYKIN